MATTTKIRVTFNDVANFASRHNLLAVRSPERSSRNIKIVYKAVDWMAENLANDFVCYYSIPSTSCIVYTNTREAMEFIRGYAIAKGTY